MLCDKPMDYSAIKAKGNIRNGIFWAASSVMLLALVSVEGKRLNEENYFLSILIGLTVFPSFMTSKCT